MRFEMTRMAKPNDTQSLRVVGMVPMYAAFLSAFRAVLRTNDLSDANCVMQCLASELHHSFVGFRFSRLLFVSPQSDVRISFWSRSLLPVAVICGYFWFHLVRSFFDASENFLSVSQVLCAVVGFLLFWVFEWHGANYNPCVIQFSTEGAN